MHRSSKVTALGLIGLLLSGCALTPAEFSAKRYEISDTRVCKTWRSASNSGDSAFLRVAWDEVSRRGLDREKCQRLETDQDVAIGAGILIGLAALAAAKGGSAASGAAVGGSAGYGSTTYDYDWEWDQFYNQYRNLVWACRGVQTGQFADPSHCAGKLQTDWKWPAK